MWTMTNKLRERIKYELRTRGLSFSALSRKTGIDPSVFSAVSAGKKRSRRAALVIAESIGSTPEKLWPEIYRSIND